MKSMTYSILPTREEFDAAFNRECPNGYHFTYNITLSSADSRACDGFKLGDGKFSGPELWDSIVEIVTAKPSEQKDAAMDIVSSILYTLGFEWI